ncbi:MAG: SPFH domain-containing protein [Planctomycetota bacterium]|jgi:regulator of protease activity HflC (stomatin/prohibitin superfamily)
MTEAKDYGLPEAPGARQFKTSGSHKGFVFGAAVLVSVAAVLAYWYGAQTETLLMKALGLEAALVALAAWLSLHAGRIRQRLADYHEWESQEWQEADSDEVEAEEEVGLYDVQHAWKLHFTVFAAPATLLVGFLAGYLLFSPSDGGAGRFDTSYTATATGTVMCLIACCLWLVLSKTFEAAPKEELPEAPSLMLAFRDLQWLTLLAAAGILGTAISPKEGLWGSGAWSKPDMWAAGIILVWLMVVSLEQLIRIIAGWARGLPEDEPFEAPTYLLFREAVFVRGNPIASLFETIEARFGVSLRSSWAIRFVRAAAVPSLAAVLLLFWGLTCLTVVDTAELGVRESFGRVDDELLQPGLHWKLPWPFGRVHAYPVKEVFVKTIGSEGRRMQQRAYLWGEAHAEGEFALVLGSVSEVVAVDGLIYYKIHEDKDRFLDYVYSFQGPEEVEETLDAYAYRALMEQTCSRTLKEVLSTNREEFASQLKQSIRDYCEHNRLGLDVVDVALVSFHPPVEVAEDYLDVINAEIEADARRIEAEGNRSIRKWDTDTQVISAITEVKVYAAGKIGRAHQESQEFAALGNAHAIAPAAVELRLRLDTLREILGEGRSQVFSRSLGRDEEEDEEKQTFIVHESLAKKSGGVLIDFRQGARDESPIRRGDQ